MTDEQIRPECLKLAHGCIEDARRLYQFVVEANTPDKQLAESVTKQP